MVGSMTRLCLALVLVVSSGLPAKADRYDDAAGNVSAAAIIGASCNGISVIGKGDQQSFVLAASDILATQGFRTNRIRTILFYGDSDSLVALGVAALARRSVSANDTKAMCRFGTSVAGTRDVIGQFLKRGE